MGKQVLGTAHLYLDGIEIYVERKNIKNLYLKISGDRQIRVSAPVFMDNEQILAFAEKKKSWILQHIQKQEKGRSDGKPQLLQKEEELFLWGVPRKIRVVQVSHGKSSVRLRQDEVIFYIREEKESKSRELLWKNLCRKQLEESIPDLILKWEKVIGVTVKEWRIKDMKTRWGSCNVVCSRVWLSLMLAARPKECLEEVIVHEMIHLLEPSHNKRFYSLMNHFLPEWKQYDEWLKK